METLSATPSPAGSVGVSRTRSWTVVALVALTTLSTFVSTIAVWGHAVLLNTDRWVATVGPLAADEAITEAVADYVVDQVVAVLDVEQLAVEALPDRADFLAAPLTSAVQGFVTDQVAELLQTEQFRTLWVEANRFAHTQAVRLLRGEPGVVMAQDGTISLNLLPLIGLAFDRLDERGLLPSSFENPAIDHTTPPAEAIAALSDALGVGIPEDFGQITVYDDRTLAQAQEAVRIFDRAVVAIVVLTVLLGAAALALSPDRRRTVLQLGLAVVGALVLSVALVNAATDHVLAIITDDLGRSAAAAVVAHILASLRSIGRWVAWTGVAAAAVAFLTGDSDWAHKARTLGRQLRGGTLDPGARAATGDDPGTLAALAWLDRHRDALRLAGVAVAFAVLMAGDLGFGGLLILAGGLALYQGVIALVPRGRGETPAGPGA